MQTRGPAVDRGCVSNKREVTSAFLLSLLLGGRVAGCYGRHSNCLLLQAIARPAALQESVGRKTSSEQVEVGTS